MILMALSLVFSLLAGNPAKPKQEISFSALAQKINSGEVESIQVQEDNLAITLKDKTELISHKEAEASLSESLINYGVTQEALGSVAIQLESAGASAMFWLTLAMNVVPIIIIVAIFWAMSRQGQKGMMQAFNFGKANL